MVTFASLDGSGQDDDGAVNGVFTVNGDLTITATGGITCNDVSATDACPITIQVGGNFVMQAGSLIQAEDQTSDGSGGNITITVGGTSTIGGTISSSKEAGTNFGSAGNVTFVATGNLTMQNGSKILAEVGSPFGSGGTIVVHAAGDMTMQGTATISSAALGSNNSQGRRHHDPGRQLSEHPAHGRVHDGDRLAGARERQEERRRDPDHRRQHDGHRRSRGVARPAERHRGDQPPGGGTITLKAGCALTVSSTGEISSEGRIRAPTWCTSRAATWSSTVSCARSASATPTPTAPPNHCNGDTTAHPLRGAQFYTACVEVWANNITINPTAEVYADGIRAPASAWIDLFASNDITVVGDTAAPYAVHANPDGTTNTIAGLITAKADGTLTASNRAFRLPPPAPDRTAARSTSRLPAT